MKANYVKTEITIEKGLVKWRHQIWIGGRWIQFFPVTEDSVKSSVKNLESGLRQANYYHEQWCDHIQTHWSDQLQKFSSADED